MPSKLSRSINAKSSPVHHVLSVGICISNLTRISHAPHQLHCTAIATLADFAWIRRSRMDVMKQVSSAKPIWICSRLLRNVELRRAHHSRIPCPMETIDNCMLIVCGGSGAVTTRWLGFSLIQHAMRARRYAVDFSSWMPATCTRNFRYGLARLQVRQQR